MNSSERYVRQIAIPKVGTEGQQKLFNSKVLIVGIGGLGNPVATYLVAAGIGEIGLLDPDEIAISNLHRQTLFTTADSGLSKAVEARNRLLKMNPTVKVEAIEASLSAANALSIISRYDLIIECSDSFEAKYLANDACALLQKPIIIGSVSEFEGQCFTLYPINGPCLFCVFPEKPSPELAPSCSSAGILGPVCGIVGTFQALEAIKTLLGISEYINGNLYIFNFMSNSMRRFKLSKNDECPICSPDRPNILQNQLYLGENLDCTPHIVYHREFIELLESNRPPLVIDVRDEEEVTLSRAPFFSVNIPMLKLRKQIFGFDLTQKIVVFCQSGVRSKTAVTVLLGMGAFDVVSLHGGLDLFLNRTSE